MQTYGDVLRDSRMSKYLITLLGAMDENIFHQIKESMKN